MIPIISLNWFIMRIKVPQTLATQLFLQQLLQANNKENIKLRITMPLWGDPAPHKGPVMWKEVHVMTSYWGISNFGWYEHKGLSVRHGIWPLTVITIVRKSNKHCILRCRIPHSMNHQWLHGNICYKDSAYYLCGTFAVYGDIINSGYQ